MQSADAIKNIDQYTEKLIHHYGFEYSQRNNICTLSVPDRMGKGYILHAEVSDDISMEIMDIELKHPLAFGYDDYDNDCAAVFCVSGELLYTETGVMKASLGKNEMGIFAHPHSRGITILPSGKRVCSIGIGARGEFLNRLPYQELCDTDKMEHLVHKMMIPRRADARSRNYFNRVMENNMSSRLRNTYLDSLGKLLLAELWQEHVVLPMENQEYSGAYSRLEKEALQIAREILSENYASPPTIGELAKLAAINEYKLKAGFRELYGKTVYGFIRTVRMENASHMLENQDLSIGEIAGRVGYVNTSHFARAFRREYGVNPSEFRIGV